MMNVTLICVGKMKEKFYIDAAAEYQKRLSAFCRLTLIELPEEKLPPKPSQALIDAALAREAAAVRSKLPPNSRTVALCIEGQMLSSEALAETLGAFTVSGTSRLALLIGGSCGLDEALKQEAKLRLSMSKMTFPHHLARVMVLEQLYRSLNILAGGKYHK